MKLIYRDVFGTSQYDKEGNLGEESVVYDFQNHVLLMVIQQVH
jgi:hypothetical protein